MLQRAEIINIATTLSDNAPTILLGLLSYFGMEIRRDVRDMQTKVNVLWHNAEKRKRES